MNLADLSTSYKDATIPNNGTLTELVELEHSTSLIGIFHPIMDTSVAFTFLVAETKDSTPVVLEDGAGAPYSITFDATPAGYVPIKEPEVFLGFRFLKIVVADAQTGAKVLRLAMRVLS